MDFNEIVNAQAADTEHAQKCAANDKCPCGADWNPVPYSMGSGYSEKDKAYCNIVTFCCMNFHIDLKTRTETGCQERKEIWTPMRTKGAQLIAKCLENQ